MTDVSTLGKPDQKTPSCRECKHFNEDWWKSNIKEKFSYHCKEHVQVCNPDIWSYCPFFIPSDPTSCIGCNLEHLPDIDCYTCSRNPQAIIQDRWSNKSLLIHDVTREPTSKTELSLK